MSWVGRRVFTPPDPPVAVAWQSVTANGSDGATTSTQLTFTFDVDPGELSAANFTIDWATKGTMTGTGTTRVLPISDITADNNTSQTVTLASNPSGHTITPTSRSVTIYVQDIAVEWQSLTANGTPGEVTTTELTLGFDVDPGPLTTGSFILFNADITGISGTGTGRVLTINNVVDTELTLILTSPAGYNIQPAALEVSANIADNFVPITITSQPTDDTVDENADAVFSVTATSDDAISYQWYENDVLMTGETSDTLTITAVQESQNNNEYYCVLTNGSDTVQTVTAMLSVTGVVDNTIYILSQPANRTIEEGQNVSFTVVAESDLTLSYQWKDASDDSNLTGETAATLTLSDVLLSENGFSTYCTVTNSAGSVDTDTVTLTVLAIPADVYEPTWIEDFNIPELDENGRAIFNQQPVDRIMYVSEAGSDTTGQIYGPSSFANKFMPGTHSAFRTYEEAEKHTRDGFADWILVKIGDKITLNSTNTRKSGRSLTERQLIAGYGATSGMFTFNRDNTLSTGNPFRHWVGGGNFTAYMDMNLTWDKRDPTHEDFVGWSNLDFGVIAIECYCNSGDSFQSVYFENCKIKNYLRGFNTYGSNTNVNEDIIFRDVIFEAMYKHPTGAHPQGVGGYNSSYLMDNVIFIKCGWYDDENTTSPADIYFHSSYLRSCNKVVYRNILSIDPSSIHFKFTANDSSNPSVTKSNQNSMYNCLFLGGEVLASLGGNFDYGKGYRFKNTEINNCIAIHINETQPSGRTLGWGYEIRDTQNAKITNNVYAANLNPSIVGTVHVDVKDTADNIQVTDNVSYNSNGAGYAQQPNGAPQTNMNFANNIEIDSEDANDFIAPNRDLYSYMVDNGIGDGTDREDFINGCRNWLTTRDSRFSPTALFNYMRAGFSTEAADGVTVIAQPTNQSVTEGDNASFTFNVVFSDTGAYQWYDASDDSPLTDEDSATLSLTAVALADSGDTFYCIATPNVGDPVQSNTVTLTVTEALNEIAFSGMTANGTSGTVDTDTLTLTFDEDPTGLAAGDITVTGATKGALSGTDNTRTLAISSITVANGANVNVVIADNNGNTFAPANRDVVVYKVASAQRLTFDGVDSYADFTQVSIGDGDTLSLTVKTAVDAGGTVYLLGRNGQSTHVISLVGGDEIRVRAGTLTYFDLPASINDGEDHTLLYTHGVGVPGTLVVDGGSPIAERSATNGTASLVLDQVARFGGNGTVSLISMADLEFDISSTVTKYNIDSGSTTTEAASVGTGTMTFNNVVSGDWA
jgi:uncharacterized protein YndB with AHSA1/START domain